MWSSSDLGYKENMLELRAKLYCLLGHSELVVVRLIAYALISMIGILTLNVSLLVAVDVVNGFQLLEVMYGLCLLTLMMFVMSFCVYRVRLYAMVLNIMSNTGNGTTWREKGDFGWLGLKLGPKGGEYSRFSFLYYFASKRFMLRAMGCVILLIGLLALGVYFTNDAIDFVKYIKNAQVEGIYSKSLVVIVVMAMSLCLLHMVEILLFMNARCVLFEYTAGRVRIEKEMQLMSQDVSSDKPVKEKIESIQ